MVRTQGSNRAESIPLVGKMAGDVEAYSEAGAAGAVQEHVGDDEAKRFRTRVAGFAAGVVFALCVLGAVAANQGGGVTGGVAAALGGSRRGGGGDAGWLVPRADTSSESKRDMPAYLGDTPQGRKIVNKEGGLPGLVEHVNKKTGTTRFRMITFCNQAYWPFSHSMLQSMKFVAPSLIPFWTIIVADKATEDFIKAQAPEMDVFVDDDLQDIVASSDKANLADLKQLLSWRRMHAIYGLINADFTTVFLEPDVVFTKNPLQLFHDMLLDADIITTSDYGLGGQAVRRVNTKVIFAKPSEESKKLLDVWQRAEPAYAGTDSEKGFLVNEILPNADKMEATIHVLDQGTVSNYLTLDDTSSPTMITGTGCDDVNYKLNFMDQIVRTVLPAGPDGVPPINYEQVRSGCDFETRVNVQRASAIGAAVSRGGGGGISPPRKSGLKTFFKD